MEPNNIHTRLKELRNSLGISQTELAKQLDITPSYVSAMERGAKSITRKVVERLVELFRVSADWMLLGKGTISFKPIGLPISSHLDYQSEQNTAFSSKNRQNNSYKIGSPQENEAENSALRERRLTALWNQVINRGNIDMEGLHSIEFISVMGSYSDEVLAFVGKKTNAQIMQVLENVLDGKLPIENAHNKVKEAIAPLDALTSQFGALQAAITETMVSTLKHYPDAQELIKGAPFYVVDLFNDK